MFLLIEIKLNKRLIELRMNYWKPYKEEGKKFIVTSAKQCKVQVNLPWTFIEW
jgi:hypothetical protein